MMTIIWSGLSIGMAYALVAIAFNLVFVATRVFNFAQAYVLMFATFISFEIATKLNMPWWVSVLFCAVVGSLLGLATEFIAVRRLANTGTHNELITTLGFGVVLIGLVYILWGTEPLSLPYNDLSTAITLFGGRVTPGEILIIASALLIAGTIGFVTKKTSFGLASLATSEDPAAAQLRGINARVIAVSSFALAGVLVASVAPFVASKTYVTYHLGEILTVKGFVVLALGGFGSYLGTIVAGGIVGLLEMYSSFLLGSQWQNITIFVLLLVTLMFLPNGLFSHRSRAERLV